MKHTIYIVVIAGLIVWVYLLSNKPQPEPVEIIREIQVGQDSVIYWKSSYDSAVKKRYADSIRWQNILNERMKAVNYYRGEMNRRRDIPVPEADSLVTLMEKQ